MTESLARFPSYPAYKPSNLSWLGDIPAHWEVKRLKFAIDGCQNGMWGDEPNGTTDDIICVRVADFDRVTSKVRDTEFTLRAVPISQRRGRELQAGDLLLEKSGGGELQPVGKVVLYDLPYSAICSNFIARMRPIENYDARFLTYLFDTTYAGRLNVNSLKQNTGIQNLDSDSYLSEPAGFPPLNEQRAIAAFLDRETARLDTLIAKKEQLIERLQEKRAALISRAVTKGLDAHARMKDSGVEWLGEVPEHWEMQFVKRHFEIELGKMLDSSKQPEDGEMKPYLRAANIHWDKVLLDDVNEMKFTSAQQNRYKLEKGDLLVTEGGVTVGRSAIWQGELDEMYYQNSLNRARPKNNFPVRFLYYWIYFLKTKGFIDLVAEKSTFGHLTKEKLQVVLMPNLPIAEANEIVMRLDDECAKIDALVAKIRDGIARLREYRGALIAAAVTGKIDVRDPA